MRRLGGAVAALLALLACRAGGGPAEVTMEPTPTAAPAAVVERFTVRVVARYPHDPTAFTQGLLWHGGKLYESTGLAGRSTLRRVDLETGRVEEQAPLPDGAFGEGLALAGDRLVQLTWQEGRAFFWDPAGLALLDERRYEGEGWGLAWDGARLVQSDGTATLTFRDPTSFAASGRLAVTLEGRPLSLLNELELVDGALWANVWTTDDIVRIDPASGHVTAVVDAAALRAEAAAASGGRIDVFNGIAWHDERRTFLLTGKLWPVVFEVELVPAP